MMRQLFINKIAAYVSIFLTIVGCLCFVGCSKSEQVSVHTDFLELIAQRDFDAAYELISPKAKHQISAEEFRKRYEIMFSELGIDILVVDNMRFHAPDQAPPTPINSRNAPASSDLPLETDVPERVKAPKAEYDLAYVLQDDELSYHFEMPLMTVSDQWYVDWSPSLVVPDMTWGDRLRVVRVPATRGEIFAGEDVLAQNVVAVTIYGAREKIQSEDSFCAALAPLINKSEKYIRDKLSRGGDICPIVSVLPEEFDAKTLNAALAIPGVGIDRKSFATIRVYPFGKTLSHTLGYTGAIADEKELERLNSTNPGQYTADSLVGKSGLELAYEKELRGSDGREYYIADENNRKKSTLYVVPARDGLDLHLNIDLGLQQRLEEVMVYSLSNEQTGAAIAMNPKTGAIKALCSYPGFDPNLFVRGISEANYKQLSEDKSQPLFNRLTQGRFPPGSIIKPFTAAAALETGAITLNTVFKGEIVDDRWTPSGKSWYYPPIKRVAIRARPSPLNLQNAMITSDNIFFAFSAMETQKEPFLSYLDKLGMNTSLPFELPIAKPHVYNEGTDFDIKLLADSGYGQGEILTSPVQMAAMYTALQDGNIMVPQLVKEIYETSGNDYLVEKRFEPAVWIQDAIKPETVKALQPMLEKVLTESCGTGHTLGLRNRRLAGKTGTAQVGSREVSWLAVYTLDRDEPLLAITVIDTNGGVVKFEIVREILQYRY